MSIQDGFNQFVSKYTKDIRARLFGVNNERIDFLMDSFYKLSPGQRNGVFAIGISLISLLIFSALVLYVSEVRSLEKELSQSISSLQDLRKHKVIDDNEEARFSKLENLIKSKIRGLSFKPFFEKMIKQLNMTVRDLNEKMVDIDSVNPLSQNMKEVRIDMRISQISIPRLLHFITEVEKSGKYIRLQDIRITGQYGNKLYFDSTLVFRGYASK